MTNRPQLTSQVRASALKPVDHVGHANWSWAAFTHFGFCKNQSLVPVVQQELCHVSVCQPILFQEIDGALMPVAVMSLDGETAAMVGSDGSWLLPYTPAAIRAHPFSVAEADDRTPAILVDTRSEFVSPAAIHKRIFDPNGEPSEDFQKVRDFLFGYFRQMRETTKLTALLSAQDLFAPANSISGFESAVFADCVSVDRKKLKSLAAPVLRRLNAAGALELAYTQMSSLTSLMHLHRVEMASRHATQARHDVSREADFLRALSEDYALERNASISAFDVKVEE